MRNLHGAFVFLTLVRLAETPMFTRVDWSTVLLRRRNSFNPPVLTKFAPPKEAGAPEEADSEFRDGRPDLGWKSQIGSGRKAQMGSSDPTSPRRKASLFNLPGPWARHFSFCCCRSATDQSDLGLSADTALRQWNGREALRNAGLLLKAQR